MRERVECDLQVGDRVECHYFDGPWDGELGTIVSIGGGHHPQCGVRLDLYHPRKHTCDGLIEDGHGWWIRANDLTRIDEADCSLDDFI